jgi:arabinofuranosyltransferase
VRGQAAGMHRMRWGKWLPVCAALVIFCAHAWRYSFYALDDSFISFRYAANWANGLGPIYNAGERVDGYTSFLWVVLLAGARRLGLDLVAAAHIMGFVFGALALALAGWMLTRHEPAQPAVPLSLALGMLALDGKYVASMMDGMETALFTFLLMASMARLWVETENPARAAMPIGGALLGLLTLTRPDGVLYIPLLGAWGLWRLSRRGASRQAMIRWALGFLLVGSVLIAPWFIWHWRYYGAPFPNTFYAKFGGSLLSRSERGIDSLRVFLRGNGDLLLLVTLTLGLLHTANGEWWGLAALAVFGRVLFTIFSGGAWQGHLRFLVPALPSLHMMIAVSVVRVWRSLNQTELLLGRWSSRAVLAAAVILPIAAGNPNPLEMLARAHTFSDGLNHAHIALGTQLAEEAPPDSVIALQDAGALPYYSGLTTIDVLGLNDAHIAHLPGNLYEKYDVDYVLGREPDYIILLSRTPAGQPFSPREDVDGAFYDDARFQTLYVFREDWYAWDGYYLWLFERRDGAEP